MISEQPSEAIWNTPDLLYDFAALNLKPTETIWNSKLTEYQIANTEPACRVAQ